MIRLNSLRALLLLSVLSCVVGCTGGKPATEESDKKQPDEPAHVHPTEGPHHGRLIELGNEEYHGEVVHDEDGKTVTIYILDSHAKKQVPIDAKEVTINIKHDGKPMQFTLPASPDQPDPEGKSSRFVSNDAVLGHHLDEESAEAQLAVTINGKAYRGKIAHDHDH